MASLETSMSMTKTQDTVIQKLLHNSAKLLHCNTKTQHTVIEMLSNSYQICKPWSYMEIIAKLSMREVRIMWMLMLNIKKMNHIYLMQWFSASATNTNEPSVAWQNPSICLQIEILEIITFGIKSYHNYGLSKGS